MKKTNPIRYQCQLEILNLETMIRTCKRLIEEKKPFYSHHYHERHLKEFEAKLELAQQKLSDIGNENEQ